MDDRWFRLGDHGRYQARNTKMTRDPKVEPLLSIDHSKIIDGFAELTNHVNYLPFDTYCGICDAECHVSPAAQKYILESNRVPVKMLQRGDVYCENCRARRAEINSLRRRDRHRDVEGGRELLDRLTNEENTLKAKSKRLFHNGNWPY